MRIFNVNVQSSVSDELVKAVQGIFPGSYASQVKRFPGDYLFALLAHVKSAMESGAGAFSSEEMNQLAKHTEETIGWRVHQELMSHGEHPIDAD